MSEYFRWLKSVLLLGRTRSFPDGCGHSRTGLGPLAILSCLLLISAILVANGGHFWGELGFLWLDGDFPWFLCLSSCALTHSRTSQASWRAGFWSLEADIALLLEGGGVRGKFLSSSSSWALFVEVLWWCGAILPKPGPGWEALPADRVTVLGMVCNIFTTFFFFVFRRFWMNFMGYFLSDSGPGIMWGIWCSLCNDALFSLTPNFALFWRCHHPLLPQQNELGHANSLAVLHLNLELTALE